MKYWIKKKKKFNVPLTRMLTELELDVKLSGFMKLKFAAWIFGKDFRWGWLAIELENTNGKIQIAIHSHKIDFVRDRRKSEKKLVVPPFERQNIDEWTFSYFSSTSSCFGVSNVYLPTVNDRKLKDNTKAYLIVFNVKIRNYYKLQYGRTISLYKKTCKQFFINKNVDIKSGNYRPPCSRLGASLLCWPNEERLSSGERLRGDRGLLAPSYFLKAPRFASDDNSFDKWDSPGNAEQRIIAVA